VKFIVHFDEVGIWDREDRKTKKAVFPAMINDQTIDDGGSRKLKYISMSTYMSALGKAISPCDEIVSVV
jgi:hypothetical protein